MGFQAVVKTDPAVGIAGQEVNPKQAVYTAFNYVSDGTVQAGTFCFATALKGNVTGETNIVSLKGTSGAKPVGFVERDVIATIPTLTADASQVYPQGACPSPFAASSMLSLRARLRKASPSCAIRPRVPLRMVPPALRTTRVGE